MALNKKHFYALFGTSLSVLILLTLFLFSVNQQKQELVYVDNIRLYNGFNMPQDLAQMSIDKVDIQKHKLDSLYNVYSIQREEGNDEVVRALELEIKMVDQELKILNNDFSKAISQQVWLRLNQYLKEYAEEKEYKIVFGTQGDGNIMFAENSMDITEDVLTYANTKYEGG